MKLRSLTASDGPAIRALSRRSMESAYKNVLPDSVVTLAVDEWYSDEAIAKYVAGEEMDFVVATIDDELVGFVQSHRDDSLGKGRLLWVHVDPDHRGSGIGSDLLRAAIERLHDHGIETVTAVVLTEYEAGQAFYQANGFSRLSEREVEIGGETFRELIMLEERSTSEPLELQIDSNGDEYYVDLTESDRGSEGPFCPVYHDPDRNLRYGWFCTACESLKTAMDPMGRIRCSSCDNTRRPTRWDSAYL